MSFLRALQGEIRSLLGKAIRTSLDLFRITVPISVLTKVLTDLGVTEILGQLLTPVMALVGLPGSMGLVWATAMVTNLYGGMVVFASLAPGLDLSVAQVTVLTTLMLCAHALPVELRIAQKAGVRFRAMALVRIGGALLLGFLLHRIYLGGSYLQEANSALWSPPAADPTWIGWMQAECSNLLSIFLIILSLLAVMRILESLGVTALLCRLLAPMLRPLGMSREAAPVTMIGMTLGLSYGGGLIIQEARSGRLSRRDLFYSLALMSLCHSLIEDTLLMLLLGAHLSGILWARIIFSLLAVALMALVFTRFSEARFTRLLCRTSAD